MNQVLWNRLCLDSAGSDGAISEVSRIIQMTGDGANAIQWESTLFVQTATNVSYQVEVSNDLDNWTPKGSPQTQTNVGHKTFTADTAIAAAYVRIVATITGSGKAILAANITVSSQ